MGYIDSQKRENIDQIISETLSRSYGTKVSVSSEYKKGAFILNPRLNAAIYDCPSRYIVKKVHEWHKVQNNCLYKLLMDMYIVFAFSKHGRFGCKYIYFDKTLQNADMTYIMPGNMKIKVFDFSKMEIKNLLKNGFTHIGYENEKKIKIDPKWNFVLEMKECKSDSYTEDLLEGCSIDRYKYQNSIDIQSKIKKNILTMQNDFRQTVNTKEYLDERKQAIESKIDNLNNSQNIKDSILQFIKKVTEYVKSRNIVVSTSHGDLQNGNIFVTNGDIKVIDWETVGIRSIGYDLLTYYYKFRYRSDYFYRIDSFLYDEKTTLEDFYYDEVIPKTEILAIYFIEDIEWLIDETIQTTEKNITDGIKMYADKNFQNKVFDRLGKK